MTTSICFPPIRFTTEWHFGRNLLNGGILKELCKKFGGRPLLIADAALKDTWGNKLAAELECKVFYIHGGEQAKSAKTKERVENFLFKEKCGRDTILIALGGGTITDSVGYIASTFLRGVQLILVPTTLLAIVDASIGGKNGINTKYGKNLIGTLYPPQAVVADLDTLNTLPEHEIRYGMAEIIKIGLAVNPSILKYLNDPKNFDLLVKCAAEEKISIVEKDPHTHGKRNLLNFGHTVAHALERVSKYSLAHGTAVAIGCMTESHLSMQLGYLIRESFEQILSLENHLGRLMLPTPYSRSAVLKAMLTDKKSNGCDSYFVCIDGIGHPVEFDGRFCRAVSVKEVTSSLVWMEKMYG